MRNIINQTHDSQATYQTTFSKHDQQTLHKKAAWYSTEVGRDLRHKFPFSKRAGYLRNEAVIR